MKRTKLQRKLNVKNGDVVEYDGKAWTVRGNKLIHPIPLKFLTKKYARKWERGINEVLKA